MSFLIECMFGKNRDIFVSLTLLIALGLMFPFAITNEDNIFLSALAILVVGCIMHLILFFVSLDDYDSKYDKGYLVSIGLIFVGDFVFFMSNIDSNCTNYEESDNLYRGCWWSNFIVNLALFFMILYLIPLIFINRFYDDFNIKTWFKSNRFRLFYLIFCNILAIICFVLYVHFYFNIYSKAFRAWYYTAIFLHLACILIALFISYTNDSQHIEVGTHRRYSPLYSWWIINVLYCVFGCVVYWDIKSNASDGLYSCAQFVMFSGWNLWLMTESFVPINVNEKQSYQMIQI